MEEQQCVFLGNGVLDGSQKVALRKESFDVTTAKPSFGILFPSTSSLCLFESKLIANAGKHFALQSSPSLQG